MLTARTRTCEGYTTTILRAVIQLVVILAELAENIWALWEISDRDNRAKQHPNLASFLCGGFAAAGEPVTGSPVWQVNIGLSFQLSAFILLPLETKAITTRVRQSARPIRATQREKEEGGKESDGYTQPAVWEEAFSSPVPLLVKLIFQMCSCLRSVSYAWTEQRTDGLRCPQPEGDC